VQEVAGFKDHRADDSAPVEIQYAASHSVEVEPGGVLARVLDRRRFHINSLHGQAVNRLAPGLVVEARAPDGVIEAFSKPEAPGFNLCVQWHPEWLAQDNPISMQLLAAFGAACRERRSRKTTP
jgi:putative glutamine amidotransferase